MKPISWNNISIGDIVYIDNYQDGKYPKANPKISGPYKVVHGNGCGRCLETTKGRVFMHYPDNLLMDDVYVVE